MEKGLLLINIFLSITSVGLIIISGFFDIFYFHRKIVKRESTGLMWVLDKVTQRTGDATFPFKSFLRAICVVIRYVLMTSFTLA